MKRKGGRIRCGRCSVVLASPGSRRTARPHQQAEIDGASGISAGERMFAYSGPRDGRNNLSAPYLEDGVSTTAVRCPKCHAVFTLPTGDLTRQRLEAVERGEDLYLTRWGHAVPPSDGTGQPPGIMGPRT